MRELTGRVERLEAERDRLEKLLATALQIAVGDSGVDPLDLLDVVAALNDTNLGRAELFEVRRRDQEAASAAA